MRKHNFALALALMAAFFVQASYAQNVTELNPFARMFPTKARYFSRFAGRTGSGGNLSYHGGPTITTAHVRPIFWGPDWVGSRAGVAASIQNYISAFGQTGEYNVITQYSGIQRSSLAIESALFDTTAPNTNVTDADIQAEVVREVGAANIRSDTIYEVFLPSGSFASFGTSDSCGGPNLTFCAYHNNFTSGSTDVKYASMPYPSCGGCQSAGFSDTQNFEHFISHETREAVTDPDGTAWFDKRGQEADDKCAWSPTPFTDALTGTNQDQTAFAYQYEWSNASSSCVKTR